jgi:hypothetical protein
MMTENERTKERSVNSFQVGDRTFRVGEQVIVNPTHDPRGRFRGITYEIERFKQVNALLRPVSGSSDGRKLNCRPDLLLHASDRSTASDVRPTVIERPYLPPTYAGQVVTVADTTSSKWTYAPGTRFVVLGETTADRVKIAKLGGEEGRTWTLPRSRVTVVDL